jgi:MFS superfamily sulfate permease-like transporter
MYGRFENLKYDIPASIVVFFVAVPLCLGIALASGAPLFSGVVSGIIGGIVVGIASGSALGVSGPAAGLSAVVLTSLVTLGNSWETFLLAVVLAGILQIIAGFLGGGVVAYYFPSSVIKGMLTGIGVIIIIKQIPYALGLNEYTKETMDIGGANRIFEPFIYIFKSIQPGPTFIAAISLILLVLWETVLAAQLQGPIVVVLLGITFVWCGYKEIIPFTLNSNDLVSIPVSANMLDFFNQFYFPDFSQILNPNIYKIAIVIAVIASLETLLCVEATDKLDSMKRVTPTNRELYAQGLGNIICGLLGGLPVTQVIVRSSANITFGARTKLSSILHGALLLLCVATIPTWLNMIPLASLAAILILVGYKLAKPMLFKKMYHLGWEQFVPFITTVLGVIFEDLLAGIGIGMAVAIFIILRHNYRNSHESFCYKEDAQQKIHLTLAEEVSFLNKGSIIRELKAIPNGAKVIIDCSRSKVIDYDVLEALQDFMTSAITRNINVQCIENENVKPMFNGKQQRLNP